MKTLMLIRHAKSCWKNAELEDADRPLNKSGKQHAIMMGKRLAKQMLAPDLFVCSSAKRAIDTANIISYEISYPVEDIVIEPQLYLAGADDFVLWVQSLENHYSHVWAVGHNPAISELAHQLCDNKQIVNLSTGSIYRVEFNVSRWTDLMLGEGKEIEYDYPNGR